MGYPWQGPQTGCPGGAQKLSQNFVPTGRVIKYPKKCALFCPPGGPPGVPKGHPGGTPLDPHSKPKVIKKRPKKGPFWGSPRGVPRGASRGGPRGGSPGGPPGGPPGGAPGGPGGAPGGTPQKGPFWGVRGACLMPPVMTPKRPIGLSGHQGGWSFRRALLCHEVVQKVPLFRRTPPPPLGYTPQQGVNCP